MIKNKRHQFPISKAYTKLSAVLALLYVLTSCSTKKLEPFVSFNEVAGSWQGYSLYNEKDTLFVNLTFDGEAIIMSLFNDDDLRISYECKNRFDNLFSLDTLKFKPTNITAWNGGNCSGCELNLLSQDPKKLDSYPNLKLIKVDSTQLQILFDVEKVNNLIYSYTNKMIGLETFKTANQINIKKNEDSDGFWFFNPYTSLMHFNTTDNNFITVELETAKFYEVARREILFKYFDLHSENMGDKTLFLKDFSKNGSVFKIDINNDKQEDIAGYFIINDFLYFKLFINNGITYYEFFSKQLLLSDELRPVYIKDTLKGKNVLRINYVYHYTSNYLYYDNIDNQLKEYQTD
ncbi:MAG: hypothetical protein J0L69_12920 [Bacteroidetes bacterium]|nr:hypothetical protein [Bacteroidota bacterium]